MPALFFHFRATRDRLLCALTGNLTMPQDCESFSASFELKGRCAKTISLGLEGILAQKFSHVDKLKILFSSLFIALIRKNFFQSSSKKVNAPRLVQCPKLSCRFTVRAQPDSLNLQFISHFEMNLPIAGRRDAPSQVYPSSRTNWRHPHDSATSRNSRPRPRRHRRR
jgi:hypothetical protein